MSILGFRILPNGTTEVLLRHSVTSPCYQDTSQILSTPGLEPGTLPTAAFGGATVPDCDGREQHHSGHIVQECREDGGDETQDDDHGPHSPPGQLISLHRKHEHENGIISACERGGGPVTVPWCCQGPHLACLGCVPGVSISRVSGGDGAAPTSSQMSHKHATL